MKFGAVPVGEAEGAILAHSLRTSERRIKKGRMLDASDVEALRASGFESVVVARLEPGDVTEDAAAEALAEVVAGPGIRVASAFTGRSNLFAEHDGLLVVDEDRLDRLNFVGEELTAATVPPFSVVSGKQMVGTVKVIPFAVPESHVEACRAIATDGGPLVRVAAFRGRAVGLCQTRLPGMKESILDKTARITGERLESLGSRLVAERRCDHAEPAIAGAIRELLDEGAEMVLVAGASAIVDRRDVVPAGIERVGGHIEHFGMPVDPGNLLLLAYYDAVPVIGLPGCARSPKLSGFDYVLRRLLAGVPVTPRDIMAMGAAGLLKENTERPAPRAARPEPEMAPARSPRIAAVVLAAGQSRRMGAVNKLLEQVDGTPLVAHVVNAVLASSAGPVYVVTGHERPEVEAALAGRDVTFVHNPDYAAGLSTSLARGLAALPDDVDGALACLGDMPKLTANHVDRLVAAFDPVESRAICVPTFRGKRGNPVLWSRRFFAEMKDVKGDVGARHLVGEHEDQVCEVEMPDDAVLFDVDSPDVLARLRGG